MMRSASAQSVLLASAPTITPNATTDQSSKNRGLLCPPIPIYSPDDAETMLVSPGDETRLILTSGDKLNLDINGNYQP
jgi:hypothetical protein